MISAQSGVPSIRMVVDVSHACTVAADARLQVASVLHEQT